ncbi:MAG: MFS transporter [Candidatus Dormibacteraeota bacterium]|nr:MFS transporter [Candidatus Dormibacteraeota bacterium]
MATTAARPRPSTEGGARRVSPRLVLAVILTVQLMVVIDATIVNVALPGIARALHFTAASLSWVVTGYTLAFGGLLLLGARAGDLLGRRRTFMAGIAIFTLASLAGGAAPSAAALLAARAVQGMGGALAAPSALALLMVQFPEGRARTRALGWFAAVSIGGMALGLILGGLLTQFASWRWVFFVNVPIGIALVAASRAVLVETPTRHGRFDIAGALLSTTGVTSLAYGFVSAAQNGWGAAITVLAFTAGVVLLAAFVAVETRAAEPITPLGLFLNRTRAAAYVARLLLLAGVFGMFFFLTQFMQEVRGYGSLETGLAFLPFTLLLFVMSQLTARVLLERYDAKRLMVVGLTISTLGMVVLTQLSASSGYLAFLIPMLLFGLGNGLAFVPLTNAGLHGVQPSQAGAASGLVNVMQQLGAALGLAVLVSVFGSAGSTGVAVTAAARAAFVTGADHAFIAGAIFVAASLAAIALAIPGRRAVARATAAAEVPAWVRTIGEGEGDDTPVAASAH